MPHVIFICTANICRSPVAEAVLRDRLQKRGLVDWQVSSAGTWAMMKREASRNSVLVMAERGLDINDHQSQLVEQKHLEMADLVLCMEAGHAEALRIEFPAHKAKIFMFSEMVERRFSINDPYGQSLDAYEEMAQEVIRVIDAGLERIIELAKANAAQRA